MIDVGSFLQDYPDMMIVPVKDDAMVLQGKFKFSATPKDMQTIIDSYCIKIFISEEFPRAIPRVIETVPKIPRDGNHHVNYDDTLCMGSPLRLLQKISEKPNLVGFAENCLVPYLYSVSYKIQTGKGFPFGELAHGDKGIIDDYISLFGLKTKDEVRRTLKLLCMKERLANKNICPCGCGKRLGKCSFRYKLNTFRNIASRTWFRDHLDNLKFDSR